ncbi:MAG: hypothetical protein LBV51_01690 [Acholeplasmatales bacterium]|jgi:hypothetical protein|nr:hypothetical protein [Acholeplasmatales bacterium]
MKKLILVFMVLLTSLFIASCGGVNIDGHRFECSKSILNAVKVAGKDTPEDLSDDIYTVTFDLTISIRENKTEYTVYKNKWVFSETTLTFHMANTNLGIANLDVETALVNANLEGTTTFKFVYLWVELGNKTKEEVEQLQKSFNIKYGTTRINLTTGLIYK